LTIKFAILFLLLAICNYSNSQQLIFTADKPNFSDSLRIPGKIKFSKYSGTDLFNVESGFIENIGQYGDTMQSQKEMGRILYGYEGMGMPFLLTTKGIIKIQRKIEQNRDADSEPEEALRALKMTYKVITMQWLKANPNPEIIKEEKHFAYHTYGLISEKAFSYKKITYKELYPGIDVVYSFTNNVLGFEYSIIARPGADLSLVKMQFGGDIKNIAQDVKTLLLSSELETIFMSNPICFYKNDNRSKINAGFIIKGRQVNFKIGEYDTSKAIVIDPFISSSGNLSGANSGIAMDVDYDYSGNVYVSGGGDAGVHQLAKYDSNGILQWTFNGSFIIPNWNFGIYYGGWTIEKSAGNIYLGQGFGGSGGKIIRLNTLGIYDNYITTANNQVQENWKMIWSCNGIVPQILMGGGSTNSDLNMGIISPPSVTTAFKNITGIPFPQHGQDLADFLIDPVTNNLYSIFCSNSTLIVNNRLYKHRYPYDPGDKDWDNISGYNSLSELNNRPYLSSISNLNDNSANLLAINSRYLFYWDGRNLKAFDKNTGNALATPISYPTMIPLFCGGIVADECDNVFIGFNNGTIKVLRFTTFGGFDDSPPDIIITGHATASVYDLAYDDAKHLLYASGSGFVASIDVSAFCSSAVYSLSIVGDCITGSATVNLSPVPTFPVSYSLYDGTTFISTNTTGSFTNLNPTIVYTIIATVNPFCSGPQSVVNFRLDNAVTLSVGTNVTICEGKKTILFSTSNAATIIWSPAVGLNNPLILNPEASPATTTKYYINASIGICSKKDSITVFVNPAPIANAGKDSTVCFGNTAQLNGSGSTNYLWTPTTYLSNPAINNPTVNMPVPGSITYSLTVTDANGCQSLNSSSVNITVTTAPSLFAGNDTAVAINQPIQLNALDVNNTGFVQYLWNPAYGLSNPTIANPIAVLDRDITYSIIASTTTGCQGVDVIKIKVYKGPEIYVPNSFSPNNDQLNDILRAIPIGMKEFRFFSIYNRYGQLIFTTRNAAIGWDGKLNGKIQDTGGFAWIAEAVDYKGKIIFRKGTVLLIR